MPNYSEQGGKSFLTLMNKKEKSNIGTSAGTHASIREALEKQLSPSKPGDGKKEGSVTPTKQPSSVASTMRQNAEEAQVILAKR